MYECSFMTDVTLGSNPTNEPKWPIPVDVLFDGSRICLKNAGRLANDARMLYESQRYSSSISLSVLALEELGKMFLLYDAEERRQPITSKKWRETFKSHGEKIAIITAYLDSHVGNNSAEKKGAMRRLSKVLKALSFKKMESIYVDWDEKNGCWHYFDNHDADKQKIAKTAMRAITSFVDTTIQEMGSDDDLKFIPVYELLKLFRQGKINGICDTCYLIMMTPDEHRNHAVRCNHYRTSWHYVPAKI